MFLDHESPLLQPTAAAADPSTAPLPQLDLDEQGRRAEEETAPLPRLDLDEQGGRAEEDERRG